MRAFLRRILQLFRPVEAVPPQFRDIFFHLMGDVAWFGLLNGTTIAFQAVFMTRQGATATHIGMLTAVPALVNLLLALPVGGWLNRHPLGRTVFWSSMGQRVFYLLMVPIPMLLLPRDQVWVMILVTLVMSIPGVALGVGFNSFFGEAVSTEMRAYVVGLRNAILSIVTTVFTLLSGFALDRLPYPMGYEILFLVGAVGAGMSSYHLYALSKRVKSPACAPFERCEEVGDSAELRKSAAQRLFERGLKTLRIDAMKGHFGKMMGLLFCWHLFQYMVIPIITPYVVNQLRLSDQFIGMANALFNSLTFIGSLFLNRATIRFGNKTLTGGSIMLLAFYPILISTGPAGYVIGSIVGGTAWAITGGALYNYILENIPGNDRPAHMAWYTLVSNGAILLGSMIGPSIAAVIGFPTALVLFGIGRFLSGAAIKRWG